MSRTALAALALTALFVLTGCAASSAKNDEQPIVADPTLEAEAQGTSGSMTHGDMVGTNVGSIDDYLLFTQDLPGLNCSGDPLEDWIMFQSGGSNSTQIIYANSSGQDYLRTLSYCDSGKAAGIDGEVNPGVIEVFVSLAEKDALEESPICRTTELITGCYRHLGNSVYVSATAARDGDGPTEDFVAAFLNTYIETNQLIPEYAAQ